MSCNCIELSIWALSAETSQEKVGFSCLNGGGGGKYLNFSVNGKSNRSGFTTNNPSTWTDDWTYNTTKLSIYIYMVQDYGIITVYEHKNYIYKGRWDIGDDCCPNDPEFNYSLNTDATLTTNPPRIQCEISDPEDPLSPTVPVVISAEDVLTGPTEAGLYEAEFCTIQIINCNFVGLPATCPPGSQDSAGTATPTCASACAPNVECNNGKSIYYNNYTLTDCEFDQTNKDTRSILSNQGLANEVTDEFVYQVCKESTTKKIEKLKTNIIDTCEPLTNLDENWISFSGITVKAKTIDNIPTAQKAIFRVCVPKKNVDRSIKVEGKFYLYIGATCQSCCVDEDNFGGTILTSEPVKIFPGNSPIMTKGGIEYFYKDVLITYDNDTYSQYAGETIHACFTLISLE